MSPFLVLGGAAALLFLLGGKKEKQQLPPGGVEDEPDDHPLGVEDKIPPPNDPNSAATSTTAFTIRAGDYPSALAAYYTGQPLRFKELPTLNPHLGPLQTVGGVSSYPGWQVGVIIQLPASWNAHERVLPKPGTLQPSTQTQVA